MACHRYIPLNAQEIVVLEEVQRQRVAGMPECDCSNCRPAEGEALWLAQPALTTENFDDALKMSEEGLMDLLASLPDAPLAPTVESTPVAFLCGPDDPILKSNVLESLVTRLDLAFTEFFTSKFPKPWDLGPEDYFGRDLAWDLAKNIDLFSKPCDLGLVLASESTPGQFACLFDTFLKWQLELDTSSAMDEAVQRRHTSNRPNGPGKAAQSTEGASLAKTRADAAKAPAKKTRKAEQDRIRQAKMEEKLQKLQQKERLEAQKKATKDAATAERQRRLELQAAARAAVGATNVRATSHGSKRIGVGHPAEVDPKRRSSTSANFTPHQGTPPVQTTTSHSPTPIETGMIDPRLCQL
ncbi:uncharacterized protein MELLADRAFT_68917 [Melampsora larici-populina 98AG31]|uniref:Uncharacterized protein n=1 Tax=Melampsora larici-populina (strain 98AG31 / pathotype 3-4-7) TaxID=747676 RepID=F4S8P9_MELLP|nr:uncharacterized protein MELLADRAFT_68917 [Melampsora larici-populina 98AG31]EGF98987.1 hypothetical protein MELLADRAFT_68917 [Melampsora larici-populina 98AG31]